MANSLPNRLALGHSDGIAQEWYGFHGRIGNLCNGFSFWLFGFTGIAELFVVLVWKSLVKHNSHFVDATLICSTEVTHS